MGVQGWVEGSEQGQFSSSGVACGGDAQMAEMRVGERDLTAWGGCWEDVGVGEEGVNRLLVSSGS